jgi:hypothetical protein
MRRRSTAGGGLLTVALLMLTAGLGPAIAQQAVEPEAPAVQSTRKRVTTTAWILAGGAVGLVAHESGHLLFDVVFDAGPTIRKVNFHGIPFFAISHRAGLPPRQEYAISSAGFLVQHAGSEWLLTKRPQLRNERAPFAKGILAFNVITSAAYAGTAFARTGPVERDTRGMADASRMDERWIGAIVLVPAVFDTWRYFDPDAKWAAWASRAAKIGMVLLVLR